MYKHTVCQGFLYYQNITVSRDTSANNVTAIRKVRNSNADSIMWRYCILNIGQTDSKI